MMRVARVIVGLLVLPLSIPPAAIAAPRVQPRPEIFTRLLDCRLISESAQRLACYDQQVAAMDGAAQRDEVVVLDKEELKKTRRSLFGFSLPKLPFLGESESSGVNSSESLSIETTITGLTSLGYGKWLLKIEDGAEWQTTEALPNRTPKKGMKVEIKHGAMGSFLININEWHAVRAKRVG